MDRAEQDLPVLGPRRQKGFERDEGEGAEDDAILAVRRRDTRRLRAPAAAEAEASAMVLAGRLHAHPQVALTRYPGLPSHPTHAVARTQLRGFGTIISFDVRGDAATAGAVCARVGLIQHATSLGAVESTMERRARTPGQEHIPPSLLRLSVGIEDPEDLWVDLDEALRATASGSHAAAALESGGMPGVSD